ncbi:MAG TPA: tetratricopeptide repeat protein [Bryobacteraceae bacterium]|nr:tetratricopeptide repeat protein [Bryobacteraceae bacterium]
MKTYTLCCLIPVLIAVNGFGQNPNSIFLNADIAGDQKLAAQGNIAALTRLGFRHLTGSAGTVDGVQAYNYLAQAAQQWPAASALLGYAAVIRPELAGKNINGVNLIIQASNAGDPVGMTLLGRLYHLGRGVPQNTATARQLYNHAAPNFALASTFLGETYLQSANSADHASAVLPFLNAAMAGETLSMAELALMYVRGDGVKQNYLNAAQWLEKAAQLGDPIAAYQRGLMYFKGQGSQKSQSEAVFLYRRAALAGYSPAQAELGVCFAKGRGVAKDLSQALYWLSLAAPTSPYAAEELALLRQGAYND